MNEDMNGNMKLFWKVVSNAKGGKVESCSIIKDGNGRLAQGENEVGNIWKEYFENMYNILRKTLQYTFVSLMGFGEVTTSKDNQLEELRLR